MSRDDAKRSSRDVCAPMADLARLRRVRYELGVFTLPLSASTRARRPLYAAASVMVGGVAYGGASVDVIRDGTDGPAARGRSPRSASKGGAG